MKRQILIVAMSVGLGCVSLGCQSAEARQKAANEAQEKADQERDAAVQRVVAAKAVADQDLAKVHAEALRDTERAQGKADKAQGEATESLLQGRGERAQRAQKVLDDLLKRRQDVQARLSQLTEPAPVIRAALKDVQEKEVLVNSEVRTLESASATTLDYVQAKLDRQLADLQGAVRDLEARVTERR